MSSAPTQIAVAPTSAGNLTTTSTSQIQKDYLEEPLTRQNSLGNRGRGGLKGKALTRSHAMREAASPPRTPTPRADQNSTTSPITSGNHSPSSPEKINDSNTVSKMHVQSVSSTQTTMETPAVIVTTQQQQQQQTQSHSNVVIYSSNENNANSGSVICNDVDFPKLTPPKSSKGARNRDNGNNYNNNNNNNSGSGSGGAPIVNLTNCIENNGRLLINDQKTQQPQSINSPPSTAIDSTNYYNGKKVVSDGSNLKSSSNHLNNNNNNNNSSNNNNNNNINNNINNSNGNSNNNGQNNNSSINSNNNNNNNHVKSPSTNTSNRNNNSNNDNYILNNNNSSSINVSVSQLNPQASPYINSSISPPVTAVPYDKDNRCPRNESQNSNNSGNYSQEDSQNCMESPNEKSDRLSKKHRNGANSKGTKPRLKNMSGSSSSMEGGNSTSGFISRDSSTEQFTDQSGIDLVQFFKETLNKSVKDRSTLMEIEKDLIELVHDKSQKELRFQPMSSYNRMLIHRVAAFFGMEHNVDKATQQCVIVAPTKATRIPDIRFKQLVRDEPRKSILKRDTHSFDDSRQRSYLGVDRGVLDRKAKSFEEREEEYEKARRRIFRGRESVEMAEEQYWHWANNESANNNVSGPSPSGGGINMNNESTRMRQTNKLLKPMERQDSRSNVSKSHSFGGYGGPPSNGPTQQQNMLSRGDSLSSNKSSGQRAFSKQDSGGNNNAQSWRLSPSSSGYKTQTQSLRSESITPSPTGYGSSDDHTSSELLLEQAFAAPTASCGVVWAVTDMASVPRGSVLINPQTLQPFVNQDGSVYHYDPSNLPPNQSVAPGMYNNNPNNSNNTNYNANNNNSSNKSNLTSIAHRKSKTERQKKPSEQNFNNSTPSPGLPIVVNAPTELISSEITELSPSNSNANLILSSNSTSTETATTSIDNISEISVQTVVNINTNNGINGNIEEETVDDEDIYEDDADDSSTKDNPIMINREMDDIEEEMVSNNFEDSEKSTLKVDDENRNSQEKPKFINQATSPNIPSPDPEYNQTSAAIIPSSEVGKSVIKSSTSDNQTTIINSNVSTRSTPSTAVVDNKKDEPKAISSNIPIMSYATGYQTIDGTTVFQSTGTGPYTTTTYQQGPDGSVYAVPQQMLYTTYPQPIESGEIQGYFVYDQAAAARDATALVPTPVYQPSTGATVVPVAAYPSAPFGSAPIYQQQVVYTPEQFPNTVAAPSAAATGQMQQYPVTYPVGYSYPYNGYWGQTMTYYVPQPPIANAVSSSIIPPPPLPIVAQGPASTGQTLNIGSNMNQSNPNSNNHSVTSGKRNTPPQQSVQHNHHHHNHSHQQQQHHHHHNHQQQQTHHQPHHTQSHSQHQQPNLNGQSSQSVTPANATYQFATAASTGVPVALTTDPNGPTMYAIPQTAVFPNAMLPYGHPQQTQLVPSTQGTQATPAGVITHLPPQSQTVISPLITHPAGGGPQGSILPPQHISIDQNGALSIQSTPHTNSVSHSISNTGHHSGNINHGNRSCTPQSTSSTPVSTTLPILNHHHHPSHRNNPPLFATPPMLPNGYNSQVANNSYQHQHYTETHSHHHSSQQHQQLFNQQSHTNAAGSVSSSSYEKKNSYSNIKKNSASNNNNNNNSNNNCNANNNNSGGSGGAGGYNNNNSGNRQNTYSNNNNINNNNSNQRKIHENTNSSVNNYNTNNSNSSTNNSNSNSNNRQIYNTGQSNNNKRINNIDKNQTSTNIGNAGANNSVGAQNNLISGTNSNTSSISGTVTSNNNPNSAQINSEIKQRPGGIRQKPGNLDFKRNGSQRNSPSTNSAESNNNSPNSIASSHNNNHNHSNNINQNTGGGIPTTPIIMAAVTAPAEHHQPHPQTHQHQQQPHQQTMYMTRGTHIPPMHQPTAAAIAAAVANDAAAAAAASHQPLISAYNHHQVAPGGMYFKYGQTYFAHPSMATLPNNRRSPPNEIRPSLTPIYSTVNMMLPAPRQMQPRHPNPNYKGNKPSR